MPPTDKLAFEASAYLQTLIGRELIRNHDVAVVELVKNAYDSGARNVRILITPRSERHPGAIEITDDGSGMDLPELERVFMMAGYSERGAGHDTGGRVPTGEKGIGRFASDRLGTRLTVETKTAGKAEALVLEIDWTAFSDRKKRFNQISVPCYRRPVAFLRKGESGTRLTITPLRERWDRSAIESLRQTLSHLLNPFEKPASFEIYLDVAGAPKLSGPVESTPIEQPDFDIRFKVRANGIVERQLRKTPAATIAPGSESRFVEDAKLLEGLRGRLYYYLKHPGKAQVHGHPYGVFLYRDGFRVEPFGGSAADWLGVGEKRAKRAGHAHIVPTRLFGFVSISRRKQGGLRDTTSREALIDSDEARALVHVLKRELVDFLEEQIRMGIAEPRWEESRTRKATELERARFRALSVMSSGVAHELRQPLQTIRVEADNITNRLRQLGITDPFIEAAQRSIDISIERIEQRVKLILALTGTKLDVSERRDLSRIIVDECAHFETRVKENRIELALDLPKERIGFVSEALVRMVVSNMLGNAIHALAEVADGRRRKITVRLGGSSGHHVVTVQDNAMGVPAEVRSKLFSQLATGTTGGMGVGLYICNLLLKSHGGKISFETRERVGSTFSACFADQEIANAGQDSDS